MIWSGCYGRSSRWRNRTGHLHPGILMERGGGVRSISGLYWTRNITQPSSTPRQEIREVSQKHGILRLVWMLDIHRVPMRYTSGKRAADVPCTSFVVTKPLIEEHPGVRANANLSVRSSGTASERCDAWTSSKMDRATAKLKPRAASKCVDENLRSFQNSKVCLSYRCPRDLDQCGRVSGCGWSRK